MFNIRLFLTMLVIVLALALQAAVVFASERLIALWLGNQVAVWTRYADGKAYVFSILVGGRVAHWEW